MITEHTTEPEALLYMPLPDGHADVWLRRDIQEVDVEPTSEDAEQTKQWQSDEVYLRTDMSRDEVESRFDELFDYREPETVEQTIDERVSALEQTALDIQEAQAELYEALFSEVE
jgi:hypothetical protein